MVALLISAALELEFAGGIGQSLDGWVAPANPRPPAVEAKIGLDGVFSKPDEGPQYTAGAKFIAILGAESRFKTPCGQDFTIDPAFKAFAALASFRVRSPGTLQFWMEGGAGIGHFVSLESNRCFEHPALRGRGGPVFELSGGTRVLPARSVAVGLQISWLLWTTAELPAGAGMDASGSYQTGLLTSALLLLGTLSFDWRP